MNSGAALMTLARYYAREAIKAQLRRQGIRPMTVEPVEIDKASREYLKEHLEELIAKARPVLDRGKVVGIKVDP